MAKIIDFKRRKDQKEPKNHILTEGKKIPFPEIKILQKLNKSPLMKKHNELIEAFPNSEIDSQLTYLDSFTNGFKKAHSPKDFTLNIQNIQKISKEIKTLNMEILTHVDKLYIEKYVPGRVIIQEMYVDEHSSTTDTERIEERIKKLEKLIAEVQLYVQKELEEDKKIEQLCTLLVKKTTHLCLLCESLLPKTYLWDKVKKIFSKKEENSSTEQIINNWASVIHKSAKKMEKEAKQLKKILLLINAIYTKTLTKQRKILQTFN